MMEKISVIVPVYKVELYIHRCIDSILQQSCPCFELILVDDGSPDNCGTICDEYAEKDKRIHVIHQKNGGLSAARNAGLDWVFANSDSQWVTFIDSDDWVHPDYLKILYSIADQNDCKVSACGFWRTSGETLPERAQKDECVMDAETYFCDRSCGNIPSVAWAKLYRKSLFQTIRFPVGKLHEDEFTTYRLVFQAEQIAVTKAAMYAYFQNLEGIMLSKWSPRRMDALEAFSQQICFADRYGYTKFLREIIWLFLCSSSEQAAQADPENRRRIHKDMRKTLHFGRKKHILPAFGDMPWIYEQVYPCKLFWWTYFHLRREQET